MTSQCEWCEDKYSPRATGGSPQKFCTKQCKRLFEKSIRRWAYIQHAQGKLNLSELQHTHSLEREKSSSGT